MKTLREVLGESRQNEVAVGHFNISDLAGLKAVFESARALHVPVIVGLSEGERDFMGVREAAAVVKVLRQKYDYPIFLNADHTHSLGSAEEAARAGFDSIVFDRSELPFAQNISETKRAVEALKTINPVILIEGEIGEIGTGSEIHEEAPQGLTLTTTEEAREFVAATGIDILAPAVGNTHGLSRSMIRGEAQKHLDIDRIAEIRKATGLFMTLHGASGTNDDDLRRAIQAGISEIHINTEVRLAWRRGLETAFAKERDQVVPYKLLPAAVDAMKQVVSARLLLFNGRSGRA
ncbi:MAG TPA: class II fructose-bisphosphate aldolase [Candidatus Bathyarchaeia archaeon]|nr:class II fructose-bisphosphate aldolase [Candidatus Bathyarchaeia archaeon]